MTETTSPALRTALAYYHAWTSHDLDKAMQYIADDIVCDAPAGRLDGREAYLGFMRHPAIGERGAIQTFAASTHLSLRGHHQPRCEAEPVRPGHGRGLCRTLLR